MEGLERPPRLLGERAENVQWCDGAQNPNLYSVSGVYAQGPLYLSLAYEQHDEFANTATAQTDDKGIKFGAAYTFAGATTVGFAYEQLKFGGNVGATGLKKIIPTSYLSAAQLNNAGEAKIESYFLSSSMPSVRTRSAPCTARTAA